MRRKILKSFLNCSLLLGYSSIFLGCSVFQQPRISNQTNLGYKKYYTLSDKLGNFVVKRETGFRKDKKSYVTKYQILEDHSGQSKILEQSIVSSRFGILKKKMKVLRPQFFQYQVWLDKQKYLGQGKIDLQKKAMRVRLKSPEPQWNKDEWFKFPEGKGVYCFFSQIIECAAVVGFLSEAIKQKTGKMNFYLIFAGHPYFQEQYLGVSKEFFHQATLIYEGQGPDGENKFSLEFDGPPVFYFVNNSLEMTKMFWPAQGFSMVEKVNE